MEAAVDRLLLLSLLLKIVYLLDGNGVRVSSLQKAFLLNILLNKS